MKSVSELYGRHEGEDIYVVGTGASMRVFPTEWLSDKVTIGLNQAWRIAPIRYGLTIGPHLHVPEFVDDVSRPEITWITKPRKAQRVLTSEQFAIADERFYGFRGGRRASTVTDPDEPPDAARVLDWVRQPDEDHLYQWSSISQTAMNLAANMGARSIILVGCDNCALEGDHHARAQHTKWMGKDPEYRYLQYYEGVREVRDALAERGIPVLSLTPFVKLDDPALDFRHLCEVQGKPRQVGSTVDISRSDDPRAGATADREPANEPADDATPDRDHVARCPSCGSDRSRRWLDADDVGYGAVAGTFHYRRCRDCRLVYLQDRLRAGDNHRAYDEAYRPHLASSPAPGQGSTDGSPGEEGWRRGLRRVARRVRPPGPSHHAVLDRWYEPGGGGVLIDYGAGSGSFLDGAKDQGWDTVGIDFAAAAVESVAARGHTALHADDPALRDLDGRVALVRLNHVFEHLHDPRATLTRLRALLEPGGRLHLAVPNPDGIEARVFRRSWYDLDCPRHVVLFPPDALRTMVEECGFVDVDVLHQPTPGILVRSWLRARGRPDETVTAHDDLLRLAEPVAALAARAGRPGRFHVLARRPD